MFVLSTKSWKKPPSKVTQNSSNLLFSLTALTAQTAQTEEFIFQNVAYWPTVYRTGNNFNDFNLIQCYISCFYPDFWHESKSYPDFIIALQLHNLMKNLDKNVVQILSSCSNKIRIKSSIKRKWTGLIAFAKMNLKYPIWWMEIFAYQLFVGIILESTVSCLI